MQSQQMEEQQQKSLPPNTTLEQDRLTLGQRGINLLWERTQATIAISVVGTTVVVAAFLAISPRPQVLETPPFPSILSSAFFLVVGFYFGRTNHQRSSAGGTATR